MTTQFNAFIPDTTVGQEGSACPCGCCGDAEVHRVNLVEGADAPANIATTYVLRPGDTFQGILSDDSEQDWVRVDMVEGRTYQISLDGSSDDADGDIYLQLFDSSGTLITTSGNDGTDWSASLSFTAPTNGSFFVSAGGGGLNAASYTMEVTAAGSPKMGTLDELARYLTDGFWYDFGGAPFSYDTTASNQLTVNITALTAEGQQLARWAFEAWEMVADVEFVETTGSGQITFDDTDQGGYAYSFTNGNTTIESFVNVGEGWVSTYGPTLGSYSFYVYIHEIGHALGLGHQGYYNGSSTYEEGADFLNDSRQFSVMSYFDQNANTALDATYGMPVAPMMVDVLAIQNLYGAPGANGATAGDTVFGSGSNIGGYMGYVFAALFDGGPTSDYHGDPVALNLYDQGGTDTLNLSPLTAASTINMIGGTTSDIDGGIGNLTISRGTVIENLILGSGNDDVTGNTADNDLDLGAGNDFAWGNNGNDTVSAGVGQDTVYGGDGDDQLLGEAGNDGLYGGSGDDWLMGGNGNDTVGGGDDNDQVWGDAGNDDLYGADGHDSIFGGSGTDREFGGDGNDAMLGGAGNDTMWGGDGNDTLYGEDGNDLMGGSRGTDLIHGDDGDDTIYAAGGNDTISGGNGNDLLGGGDHNDLIFGGGNNDTLLGSAGNDTLDGGDGDDRIDGGAGVDRATGGAGADTFVFTGNNIHTSNLITDFVVAEGDRLELDNALWGNSALTAEQVVSTFGSVWQGDAFFIFDSNNFLFLEGVSTLTGLENVIDIV